MDFFQRFFCESAACLYSTVWGDAQQIQICGEKNAGNYNIFARRCSVFSRKRKCWSRSCARLKGHCIGIMHVVGQSWRNAPSGGDSRTRP